MNRGQWLQIGATVLFASVLTLVLVLGIRRASELQSASGALQLASELSSRPELMRSELTLIQRGLETQTYIGQSLKNLAAMRDSSNQSYALLRDNLKAAKLDSDSAVSDPLAKASERWKTLDTELADLSKMRETELYNDSANNSDLSGSGKKLKGAVDDLLVRETPNMKTMADSLGQVGLALRAAVSDSGRSLRSLLAAGTLVAMLLLGAMLYYAYRSTKSAAQAMDAQRQVENILETVREGLFLVGRDLKLGSTCSGSLKELLHIEKPEGQSFEDVLKTLVDDKTVKAALKFLGLLWRDKVHEDLIESINPLNQVEVAFAAPTGGTDTRYLAFSFRRVRGHDNSGDYILGVVGDVTDRVMLERELEQVKADNDGQAGLMLQILKVDPQQLQAFLTNADVAFRKSNAMLTAPGKEQDDLKKKLNGVFRELHAAKGEAASLGLSSFVQRIHATEDYLSTLRNKTQINGNDFMPVVVKLDELMSHAASIIGMQDRVSGFLPSGRAAKGKKPEGAGDTVEAASMAEEMPTGPSIETQLQSLTQDVGLAQSRPVKLVTKGLDKVPTRLAGTVKDICIQMIRNSIVHGLESPEARRDAGKLEEGTLQVNFANDSDEGFVLTLEDDGRGLNYEQILDKALKQGMIKPQQAMTLERAAVYKLIFHAGFSTAESVSEHAGRGVGLDAVSNWVRESGGNIAVSTVAGQYTRFKVVLPKSVDTVLASTAA
ncbi:MAG TPA: ATP-binding protein [Steroidobacteraceae bacterium]|jgi:HPt (histidine-containing phosphotransfer) domain-containing protein|nr:ATP-binding protein [Steroidobacteraceae bacterium]